MPLASVAHAEHVTTLKADKAWVLQLAIAGIQMVREAVLYKAYPLLHVKKFPVWASISVTEVDQSDLFLTHLLLVSIVYPLPQVAACKYAPTAGGPTTAAI